MAVAELAREKDPSGSASAQAATASALPARFDRATLDANTMSDPELQQELFQLFFDQMPALIALLDASLDVADASRWSAVGHRIKGTARTLGLLELAAAAIAIENSKTADRRLIEALRDADVGARTAASAYLASIGR